MAHVRQVLIKTLGMVRSQSEAMRDVGAQFQAIYDYLDARDPKFATEFAKREIENLADPSLHAASSLTLELLDKVIDALKRGELLEL